MCGRFTLATTASEIAAHFGVEIDRSLRPRYNIAPSQPILAMRKTPDKQRAMALMQWGLIPHWVKNLASWKANLINARAETVSEKSSFQGAFKYRPCLIAASGYYEWSRAKQPYYFQVAKRPLFALAGLWEAWSNGEGELITCSILTTKANAQASSVHHRMPVIVRPQDYDSWLGELEERKRLLACLPEVDLELHRVSQTVNSYKHDSPDCIAPIS